MEEGSGLDKKEKEICPEQYTCPHDHRAVLRCYSQSILFSFHGSIYLANIMFRHGKISIFWRAKLRLTTLSTLKDNAERYFGHFYCVRSPKYALNVQFLKNCELSCWDIKNGF